MTKVRKPVPALAAVVDCWWQGVGPDVEPCGLSPHWREWMQECLLPLVSWEHHVAHTRCARRKAQRAQALQAVRTAFDTHALTRRLARHVLAEWQAWAHLRVQVVARASAAVEGRNGDWSHMPHQHRGVPKRRYKGWTVLHNCDGHAADGTTPAARFFGRSFPDLFETVFAHIGALPQPRHRDHANVLSG
jgi:hypothetical protein